MLGGRVRSWARPGVLLIGFFSKPGPRVARPRLRRGVLPPRGRFEDLAALSGIERHDGAAGDLEGRGPAAREPDPVEHPRVDQEDPAAEAVPDPAARLDRVADDEANGPDAREQARELLLPFGIVPLAVAAK